MVYLRNSRFKISIGVLNQAHTTTVYFLFIDIGQRHADGVVAREFVGVNQVYDNIYLAHCATVRQKCLYYIPDGSVKSLYNSCILLAFIGKVLDIVAFN